MKYIDGKRLRKFTPHIVVALAGILCLVSLIRSPERPSERAPEIRLNHPEESWIGRYLEEINEVPTTEPDPEREERRLEKDPVPDLFAAINGSDFRGYRALLQAMRADPVAALRWILPYLRNAPGEPEAAFLGMLSERLATVAVFSPAEKTQLMEELGASLQGNLIPTVMEAVATLLAVVNDGSRSSLLKDLIRKNPALASRVLQASARNGEEAGLSLVLDVVDDRNFSSGLRSAATAALVRAPGPRGTEKLFDLAHSSGNIVTRMLAVSGLASMDRHLAASLESPALLAEILRQIEIDPEQGPSPLRGTGIVALAILPSPEAQNRFRNLLSDPLDQDGSWAITVAAALETREAVPVLFERVEGSEGRTRLKLLEAISYLERKESRLDPDRRERLQQWVDREMSTSWPNPAPLSVSASLHLKGNTEQTSFLVSLIRQTDSPTVANLAMSELKRANPEALRKVLNERIQTSKEESTMGRWVRAAGELHVS